VPAPEPLRILADADVPLVDEALARYGPVRVLPGAAIDRAACRWADAVIVRSVTRVDASILDDTRVRFVGTATAGTDHLDEPYLAARAIRAASAPGSNAESVVEWALAALLVLATRHGALAGRTLGVVGCGQVGARLITRARAMGLDVLACDPPLAEASDAAGVPHAFVSYARLLEEADILTYHTPLTFDGEHPTFHLLGAGALRASRRGVWVLNASRGAVVDGAALEAALHIGHVAAAAIDVWEGEPAAPAALVARADLATPHIAGYGYDAKVAGARAMEDALRDWLREDGHALPPAFDWTAAAPAAAIELAAPARQILHDAGVEAWLDALAAGAYDIRADDARFRASALDAALDDAERSEDFSAQRRRYPVRRSWGFHRVAGTVPVELRRAVAEGLRMGSVGSSQP